MNNHVIMISFVIGVGITLTACGNPSATGNPQRASNLLVKTTTPSLSISQQYGLVDVHYTVSQIMGKR